MEKYPAFMKVVVGKIENNVGMTIPNSYVHSDH
jgi:hypothetical protein